MSDNELAPMPATEDGKRLSEDADLKPDLNTFEDVSSLEGDPDVFNAMRSAAEDAAEVLRSIGSPYRLMILCILMESEKTVTEICEAIGARQSLTSQHLTRLRLDGLVKAERRGHFAYYTLDDPLTKQIVGTLYNHYCPTGKPE